MQLNMFNPFCRDRVAAVISLSSSPELLCTRFSQEPRCPTELAVVAKLKEPQGRFDLT